MSRAQLVARGISTAAGSRAGSPTGRLRRVHHGVYAVGHRGAVAAGRLHGGGARMRPRRQRSATRPRRTCMRIGRGHAAAARDHRGHDERAHAARINDPSLPAALTRCVRARRHPDHDSAARTARPRATSQPGRAQPHLPRGMGQASHDGCSSWKRCIARNPHKNGRLEAAPRVRLATSPSASSRTAFSSCSRAHGLARPRTNIDHHGDKVDCHWPARDVTVELLSYRYHSTRHAFEQDVARRTALKSPGVHLRRRVRATLSDRRRGRRAHRPALEQRERRADDVAVRQAASGGQQGGRAAHRPPPARGPLFRAPVRTITGAPIARSSRRDGDQLAWPA